MSGPCTRACTQQTSSSPTCPPPRHVAHAVASRYWEVRNGYTDSNTQRLEQLNEAFAKKKAASVDLHQHIKIGLHQDVRLAPPACPR